jgi:hypothetical protein
MDHPIKLVHGLPRKELIEKLTFHRRQGEVAERAVGFYLLDMQERHAYRPERDAARWAEKHLELSRADKLMLCCHPFASRPP